MILVILYFPTFLMQYAQIHTHIHMHTLWVELFKYIHTCTHTYLTCIPFLKFLKTILYYLKYILSSLLLQFDVLVLVVIY